MCPLSRSCRIVAVLLCLVPSVLWAQAELDYQMRASADYGEYYEGRQPKLVAGEDIQLISVLVDHQEPAPQLPDQLRVKFYLPRPETVYLTVRERSYKWYYWLKKVKWQAKATSEFVWPTDLVLRRLDRNMNMYNLGVVVRVNRSTPGRTEEVAPAILYHTEPPKRIEGYLFTMKTNRDARMFCKVIQGEQGEPVDTQVFQYLPGRQPFTVRWDAADAPMGNYTLVCQGYFLNNNDPVQQTIRFYHKPTIK